VNPSKSLQGRNFPSLSGWSCQVNPLDLENCWGPMPSMLLHHAKSDSEKPTLFEFVGSERSAEMTEPTGFEAISSSLISWRVMPIAVVMQLFSRLDFIGGMCAR
jgi:hypothetical protein